MGHDKTAYEVLSEKIDEEGNKTIYLKDSRVFPNHSYVVPDYSTNKKSYEKHQSKTNWVGIVSAMFMFLTLMGVITAAWITVVERITKTETSQEINIKSSNRQIEGMLKDIYENKRNVMKDYYTFDSRFKLLLKELQELTKQLERIETSVRHLSEEHAKQN